MHALFEESQAIAYLAIVAVFALLLWIGQRQADSFDIRALVVRDGKVSLSKLGQVVALATSTWGFVHLTLGDHLTEWYFTAYMLAWSGASALNLWLQQRGKSSGGEQ